MPHKKSAKGKPMSAQGVELRSVRLDLDPPTHRALRIEAAKQEMSMAALVKMLVEDFLRKKTGGSKGGA
jgi:hypothetical protein